MDCSRICGTETNTLRPQEVSDREVLAKAVTAGSGAVILSRYYCYENRKSNHGRVEEEGSGNCHTIDK
jgi:hypothetical protein